MKPRILTADDEHVMHSLLGNFLDEEGCEVVARALRASAPFARIAPVLPARAQRNCHGREPDQQGFVSPRANWI